MTSTGTISYQDFAALDIRVGRIAEVTVHPDADRLYVVQVDLGPELGRRQTVTSLVPHYSAEELQDRPVVVLVNLAPARMRGPRSECMLLCAETDDESTSILLAPAGEIAPGTKVV